MELITVRELFKNTEKYVDQEIEIGGWVRNKRPSKQFGFIVLNDGTYFTPVQVVYNDSIDNFQDKTLEECRALGINDSMIHEDFMIGCDSMNIDGICEDGSVVAIFRNGNWAF